MRTLVVVPTYEEASNLGEALRRARVALPDADLLVVDDSSPDGTADVAEASAKELGQIHVLRRPAKSGLGSAYRSGFAWGIDQGFEILCQMDADLSHDPAALPSIVGPVESGDADMVIGSRYVPGGSIPHWPRYRRALSKYGNRYSALMLGVGVRDATAGFRAYRADTLEAVHYAETRSRGYGFQIETCYRVWQWGGRILEVPIAFTDRVRGQSKMSLAVAVEELSLVSWWGVRDLLRGRRHPGARRGSPA
jgi:dolichol-phosphate mannosyltransferase